ncbi:MAG: PAS domain-containing protein [Candidatus Heimdallarchaeaceae archaeon]
MNNFLATRLGYLKEELLIIDPKKIGIDFTIEHQTMRLDVDDTQYFNVDIVAKNNSKIPVELRVKEVKAGQKSEALIFVKDLRDSDRLQESLRECEKRFQIFVETVGDLVMIHNLDGEITFFNRSIVDLLGYSFEDVQGKNIYSFISPKFLAELKERKDIRETVEDVLLNYEIEFISKNGESVPFEIRSTYFHEKDVDPQILVVGRDLSSRRKIEKALSKNRELYESVVNNASDIIIIHDENGKILFTNNALAAITGFSEKELLEKTIEDVMTSSEKVEKKNGVGGAISPYDDSNRYMIEVEDKKGKVKKLEIISKVISSKEGEYEMLLVGRDVSEKTEMEKYRKQVFRQLEENIDNFYYLVDRIRNPLSVILGFTEVFTNEVEPKIVKQVNNIADVVDNLEIGWVTTMKHRQMLDELMHQ